MSQEQEYYAHIVHGVRAQADPDGSGRTEASVSVEYISRCGPVVLVAIGYVRRGHEVLRTRQLTKALRASGETLPLPDDPMVLRESLLIMDQLLDALCGKAVALNESA